MIGEIAVIKPYGSNNLNPLLVTSIEHQELLIESQSLPSLLLNSAAAASAVMLGAGYFNPLNGYMNLTDAMSIAEHLHTTDGLFWPVPILNMVKDISAISGANRIALRDPNTKNYPVIAIMNVKTIEVITDDQIAIMAQAVFGTLDVKHPGVATFTEMGRYLVSGSIQVLNLSYFQTDFPDTFRTASEIRDEIAQRNWQRVVAFQTRNPMHRAHEELCHMAIDRLKADGVVIHMLLGKLKQEDIPAFVRDKCIRKMVELYFPEKSAMVAGYGFDMMYAGPREALLHALFRQNMGATHLIIGRDHAGVGNYYGAFDAQTIFDEKVPAGTLEIKIFKADHTAFSKKLGRVVMMREAVNHSRKDFVLLSGTKVRQMLSDGIAPPEEFARPEVAQILVDYYNSENGEQ
jgi:sulfate adenylyltransferase